MGDKHRLHNLLIDWTVKSFPSEQEISSGNLPNILNNSDNNSIFRAKELKENESFHVRLHRSAFPRAFDL